MTDAELMALIESTPAGGAAAPAAPQPTPTPGAGRSSVLGFAQGGTSGYADEIGAGLATLPIPHNPGRLREPIALGPAWQPAPDDTPEVRAYKQQVLAAQENQPTPYERLRDRMRGELAQAREAHPWATGTGDVLGGVAQTVAGTKLLKAFGLLGQAPRTLPLGQRLLRGLKAGGAVGAINATGRSDASPFSEPGRFAADTALGTATGAGMGAAFEGVAPPLTKAVANKLRKVGIGEGRRVMLSGADSLSRKVTPDEVVEETLKEGGILPFGTTKGAAERMTEKAAALGDQYAAIIADLEKQGVTGPDAVALAKQFMSEAKALEANSLGTRGPERLRELATELKAKVGIKPPAHAHGGAAPAEPQGLVDQFGRPIPPAPKPPPPPLSLSAAENMKRTLQNDAHYSRTGGDSNMEAVQKNAASMLRQSVEDAIDSAAAKAGPGSQVADLAESFRPVKAKLGRTIEAREALSRGAQKAANRSSGHIPGKLELGATLMGHPEALFASPLGAVLKERGGSTLASGAYWASRGLRPLADSTPLLGPAAIGPTVNATRRETPEERDLRMLLEALQGTRQ